MKPKNNKSVLRRLKSLGKGGAAAIVGAFQQIPFGVGTVVSLGLHGLAMPSVISWVQTEAPRTPESVDVVTLNEADLARLPEPMRNEALTGGSENSDEGSGWDWFTSRGEAVAPPSSDAVPPAASSERSFSRRSGGSSRRSRGGWRYGGARSGESQDQFLARWRQQLNRAQQRLDIEGGRSQNNDDETNQESDGGQEKDNTEDNNSTSGDGDNGDDRGEEQENGDRPNEEGNQGGADSDVELVMPEALRNRIAELENRSWEHDGLSDSERGDRYTAVLQSSEFDPWRALISVEGNQLKNEEGKVPEEVKGSYWLEQEFEKPLVVEFPALLRCRSPQPAPVRVAMLGGPDGTFVPDESPKLITSSGYGKLDAEALKWTYTNLSGVQLTEHKGYVIHLFTLYFESCDSNPGAES
ncbi:MAG: hypothetical protein ACFCBU_09500 [Cyanophyceae cyanobacterium]